MNFAPQVSQTRLARPAATVAPRRAMPMMAPSVRISPSAGPVVPGVGQARSVQAPQGNSIRSSGVALHASVAPTPAHGQHHSQRHAVVAPPAVHSSIPCSRSAIEHTHAHVHSYSSSGPVLSRDCKPMQPCCGVSPCAKAARFRCPACNDFADTMEEAIAHCSSKSTSPNMCKEGAFRCPECGEFASSIDAALAHCSLDKSTAASDTAEDDKASESSHDEDAIAYDVLGRPTIFRRAEAGSSARCTIVKDDDGSSKVFGDDTLDFLSKSTAEEVQEWMQTLTCHHLRGLSHEVGQRLVEGSKTFHDGLAELETLNDQLDYLYFGLTSDSSQKDLDNAYRKLAKKMHPDKNGGTEEAKKKFQQMKERYEALKKKFRERAEGSEDDIDAAPIVESLTDAKRYVPPCAKASFVIASGQPEQQDKDISGSPSDDIAAEDDSESSADETFCSSYDPKDKNSMIEYISKMSRQLQGITEKASTVLKQLEKARCILKDNACD